MDLLNTSHDARTSVTAAATFRRSKQKGRLPQLVSKHSVDLGGHLKVSKG
jgi:hypothetical protein